MTFSGALAGLALASFPLQAPPAQPAPAPAAQAPAAKPAPRPGEEELRAFLARMGSLKKVAFEIQKYEVEAAGGQLNSEGQTRIEVKEGQVYRVQAQGMWGDSLLVVRDKGAFLVDPLVQGESATLADVPTEVQRYWTMTGLEFVAGVTALLLSGEDVLPLLAPSSGTLSVEEAKSVTTISTTGSRFGALKISYRKGRDFQLLSVERTPNRSFFGPVLIKEEVVSWKPLPRRRKEAFQASPEKGVGVSDKRAAKPPLG